MKRPYRVGAGGLGGAVLVAGARWASRGKDAGSADSGVLSARLRTQQPAKPADERSEESRRTSAARATQPLLRRVLPMGAGLVGAALLVAGCGTGGVASAGQPPDTQSGQKLFTQSCGNCHALSAAGTSGTIGPNLDNAFAASVKEGYPQSVIENVVLDQIRLGSGEVATYTNGKLGNFKVGTPMPANLVKGQDAIDVAAYVAASVVAGRGKYTTGGGFASLGTNGAAIFKGAGCAGCHTLAAAGSTGTTGPNLDQIASSLTLAIVAHQVTNGGAVMPAFKGKLSPAQIQAVSKYVASSAGK